MRNELPKQYARALYAPLLFRLFHHSSSLSSPLHFATTPSLLAHYSPCDIRRNYEATGSSCLEKFHIAEITSANSTRKYIRLRRFLRSYSYPCGNDKTNGTPLLKRALTPYSAHLSYVEIYEKSCFSRFSPSLSSLFLEWFILNGLAYHQGRGCRRDFLTDVIVRSTIYFA